MKRIATLFFGIVFTMTLSAQYVQTPKISLTNDSAIVMPRALRVGINKNYVGGEMMNNKAFEGYLKNTSPSAFARFYKGRRMTTAGWVLTGVGGGMLVSAVPLGLLGASYYNPAISLAFGVPAPTYVQSLIYLRSALALTICGVVIGVSGATVLGVGYNNMEKAVDVYNTDVFNRAPTFWTITAVSQQTGLPGLAVAYNF